jgi:hypothetical protein
VRVSSVVAMSPPSHTLTAIDMPGQTRPSMTVDVEECT